MRRKLISGLLVYAGAVAILAAAVTIFVLHRLGATPRPDSEAWAGEPDTGKALPLHKPTAEEARFLNNSVGKTRKQVIETLGHPCRVYHDAGKFETVEDVIRDGRETWEYPWDSEAVVHFRNGVVVGCEYEADAIRHNIITQRNCD
jgi:hypothetical protein